MKTNNAIKIEKPRLTYEHGEFIFIDPNMHQTAQVISSGSWRKINPDDYVTTDFQAAFAFANVADERAQKILKRAFVQYFDNTQAWVPDFLDAHQRDGVRWILSRSRSYLAHAPGAGKTAQAIVAGCLIDSKRQVLVVVPPTLAINWTREILRFTAFTGKYLTSAIVPGTAKRHMMDWTADFIVCPDSMLTTPWVMKALRARNYRMLAVDEASRFKESDSQRTIALFGGVIKQKRISGLQHRAIHTVLLDGSPMPNRPMELWAPIAAVAPETIGFMTKWQFGMRYCGPVYNSYMGGWEYKGSSNEAELRARITSKFMHVVKEQELSHPERLRSIVTMSEDSRDREMKTWERKNLGSFRNRILSEGMNQGDIARHRQKLGLSKVDWAASYISQKLDKGESILVFAWHNEVIDRLRHALTKKAGVGVGVVAGKTPKTIREMLFRRFQAGDCRVIIGNIAAMGRGHNLQRADRVVFVEASWTDELNKQCEKRASRRGRAKELSVKCDYIACPGSLDELVLGACFTKEKRVEKVIG